MQAAAPSPLILLLLALAPPTGGSPFILLPSSSLFLFFPSSKEHQGVGEEVQFQATREGLMTGVRPCPQIQILHPLLYSLLLFTPPRAKLTAPSRSRLRLQKCTIGRRRGGGWGAWTGWGAFGGGLMEL